MIHQHPYAALACTAAGLLALTAAAILAVILLGLLLGWARQEVHATRARLDEARAAQRAMARRLADTHARMSDAGWLDPHHGHAPTTRISMRALSRPPRLMYGNRELGALVQDLRTIRIDRTPAREG